MSIFFDIFPQAMEMMMMMMMMMMDDDDMNLPPSPDKCTHCFVNHIMVCIGVPSGSNIHRV